MRRIERIGLIAVLVGSAFFLANHYFELKQTQEKTKRQTGKPSPRDVDYWVSTHLADVPRRLSLTPFVIRQDPREPVVYRKNNPVGPIVHAKTTAFDFSDYHPGEWRVAFVSAWGGLAEDNRPALGVMDKPWLHDYCRYNAFASAMRYSLRDLPHHSIHIQMAPIEYDFTEVNAACFSHRNPVAYPDRNKSTIENFLRITAWIDAAVLNAEDSGKARLALESASASQGPIESFSMLVAPSGRLVAYFRGDEPTALAIAITNAASNDPEWDSSIKLPDIPDLDRDNPRSFLSYGHYNGQDTWYWAKNQRAFGLVSRPLREYLAAPTTGVTALKSTLHQMGTVIAKGADPKYLAEFYGEQFEIEKFRSLMGGAAFEHD